MLFRRRVIGSINISNKVTITCTSKTYNGQTQAATEITVTFKGETLTENVDYTVVENTGGINVGSYTVKVKGIKKYSGEAQGLFSITKVTPTVTIPTPRTSLIYNGNAQALIVAGSTDFGTLKYSLDNSTYSTSIPSGTNATSYTVYYKVEGDSNINDVPAQGVSVSIGKVTPTVVSPTAKVLIYNGSQQELVNAGSTDFGTLQYKVGSDSWSTSIPTRQKGGSYVVQYKVVGDSNINDVAAESVQCSINEKQVTATVTLSQTAYTYNGSACQPTPTVKDGSTVIDPSEYSVTYSNNINAGTGTVTISDNVGGDYEVIGSATFTIAKADTTYVVPTANNRTYDTTSKALLNAGSVTGGTIQYSTSQSGTYSTTIPSQTNAGAYTTWWKIVGDSNHNDKSPASISTTVSPKTVSSPTITLSQDTYTYENTAFQPTPTVKDGSTTISSGEYTVSYSNNTNVGTATCTITDKSGGNYTVSGSKTFTITCYSATAPTAKNPNWTGSAQALANAGSTSYGTMVYCSTSGGTFTTTIPTGTNAGSYEVWWKVTGNTNVCNTAATKVACTIKQVAMTYTAPKAATRNYSGSAQQIVSGQSATGGAIYFATSSAGASSSTTVPTQTNAGTYSTYWKAVPDSNHSGGTSSWAQISNCVINKIAMTYTAPSATTYTYGNTARALMSGGTASGGSIKYSTLQSGTYTTTVPTQTNAGTYTTWWKAEPDSNHSGGTNAVSVSTTISKANISPTVSISNWTYGGTASNPSVAGNSGSGTVTYYYKLSSASSWSTTKPSAAGSYNIRADIAATTNYNSGTCTSNFTINKAAGSVTTAPVNNNYTYNGTARAVASAGSGTGTMYYRLGTSGSFSTTMPTMTNAGSNTLYYYAAASTNYNQSSTGSITVTVSRANRTLSWSSAPSSVEIGSTVTILAVPSAGSNDGSITYSSSNSNVASINGSTVSGKTIGSCTITATISQGTNYNSASTSYTLSVTTVNYANHYLTFTATENGTFKFSGNSISYSINNGSTWTTLASNTNSPTVSAGSKIMWKATLTPISSYPYGIGRFSSSGRFTAEGNVMSLLYGDNFVGQTSLNGKDYAFYGLFYRCTGIISAENMSLPATTLSDKCYYIMFDSCSGLTAAPSILPATTLTNMCYYGMFEYCTSLTTVPQLYATTLATQCCSHMFFDCTSLATVPSNILSATILAERCYEYMFQSCTSLTTVPTLSATTLANYCYDGMFASCSSLTTVPNNLLPATTLVEKCYCWMFHSSGLKTAPSLPSTTLAKGCYTGMFASCSSLTTPPSSIGSSSTIMPNSACTEMFSGCTSLTTAPSLPARTLGENCYDEMFRGCSSLTAMPQLPATTLAKSCYVNMFANCINLTTTYSLSATALTMNCYAQMFMGCKSLKTAPSLPATTLVNNCYGSMFSNCTSLTTAPSLPATTLAEECYYGMFWGCTNLTTAPTLSAATLMSYCYCNMFRGCTKLNSITCLATNISAEYCTASWVNGVASSGTFRKASSMSSWTSGIDGIPSGWSVQNA